MCVHPLQTPTVVLDDVLTVVLFISHCGHTHVRSHSLSIGLLEQRGPELVPLVRVHVDEGASGAGQPVVNDHLHPASVLPNLEAEDAWKHERNTCH